MQDRESSRDIDRAAARWAARLDRGPLSPEERRTLDAWTSADTRRAGALARAMAVSAHFDHTGDQEAGLVPAIGRTARTRTIERRSFFFGGAAAAVVGGLAVTASGWSWRTEREFRTEKGEFRSVRLRDGSVAWLNTDSRMRVDYGRDRRGVTLLTGEALFEVAKDSSRPFVVRAGGLDVRAVGTSFSVSHFAADRVEVLVQEGVVDMARTRDARSPPVRLTAGAHARAEASGAIRVVHAGPEAVSRALSWRRGMLNFEGETLHAAAETFARYSDERIVIDDPAVGRLTVSGLFSSTDPAGFAKAVAVSLDLETRSEPGAIHLSR